MHFDHEPPLETAEMTRRNFIRGAVGLSAIPAALAIGSVVHSLLEATEINDGASVTEKAVRIGNQTQINPPPPPPQPVRAWNPGDLIFAGNSASNKVALTFDDGPWHTYSQGVMNHLRDAGLEGIAAFAVIGNNTQYYGNILQEEVDRGYQLINHTMSHTYTPSQIVAEIDQAQNLLRSYTGENTPYFRSPGLTQDARIQAKLASLGMANIFTSTNLNDWTSPRISASSIINNVNRTVHGGNIILLHDGGTHRPTMDAIPGIVQTIRAKGLEIVTLDELLSIAGLDTRKASLEGVDAQLNREYDSTGELAGLDKTVRDWIIELEVALEEGINLTPSQRSLLTAEISRQKSTIAE